MYQEDIVILNICVLIIKLEKHKAKTGRTLKEK